MPGSMIGIGMRARRVAVALMLAAAAVGCRIARPSSIVDDADYIVAVKSARLPDTRPWIARFAHHSWFDLKDGDDEHWRRVEIPNETAGVEDRPIESRAVFVDDRFGREIHLIHVQKGPEAKRIIDEIRHLASVYRYSGLYEPWPGPNSNSFVDFVGRSVPGLHFELHHNAVGRDYARTLRFSGTTTGTGVELESPVIGVKLGLQEGVEVQLLQLTFGVSLFPPAVKLPIVDRIGF